MAKKGMPPAAEKVSAREKAIVLKKAVERFGPLYVRAVVPPHGEDDPAYTPWYVGHLDPEALTDGRLNDLARAFTRAGAVVSGEEMETFATYLDGLGYVVLNSTPGPVCVVALGD